MTVSVEDRPATDEAPGQVTPEPQPEPKATKAVDEYASFEDLLTKKARERDYDLPTPSGGVFKLRLKAIGHLEYDKLVSRAEPTESQKQTGLRYDDNKFGPLLISACVVRPKMDLDRASRLWANPNWAGGEIGALYRVCVELCQADKVDVAFTGGG